MDQLAIVSVVKYASEDVAREVDFGLEAVQVWLANSGVSANDYRRPSTATESEDGSDHSTGFIYQAAAEGQTGAVEPGWGQAAGGTTPDGSLSWKAVAPGSQNPLTAAQWNLITPPDSALTVSSTQFAGVVASAILAGGTAGKTYTVDCVGTLQSGEQRTVRHVVSVIG